MLIVLDGWGYREETQDNAIANGATPVWDKLWQEAPHTLISASGQVNLRPRQYSRLEGHHEPPQHHLCPFTTGTPGSSGHDSDGFRLPR